MSTIEEVNAASKLKGLVGDSLEIDDLIGTLQLSNPMAGGIQHSKVTKLDALSLLSNQMKTVKSSMYDFEDDVESDSEEENGDSSLLDKFGKKAAAGVIEEEIETAEHIESDESF